MSSKASVIKAAHLVATPVAVSWPPVEPVRNRPERPEAAWGPVEDLEAHIRHAQGLEARAAALLSEAEAAAARRLNEAESRAAELLAAARDEADRIRASARAEGWQAGYAEGQAAARAEAEAVVAAARAEAEQILAAARAEAARIEQAAAQAAEERLRELEPELVALALDIARQVIRTEVRTRPEAVRAMVRAALSRMPGAEHLRLRLHPDDAGLLGEGDSTAAVLTACTVEPDPTLAPGDFILMSEQGMIDGRIESQLREVAAALDPAVGPAPAGR